MEWKKILIASFIPMAILFLISLIGELLYRSLPGRGAWVTQDNYFLWSMGSALLLLIYTGYAAVRINLKDTDLFASGFLAVFFFSVIAQAAMAIIFRCNFTNLNWCFSFYILTPAPLFWFLGVVGITLGWSLALTVQKIKPKIKKPKQS
ncbi:MAG: hypothetical protein Sv326_0886 [Candidatus Fermentimicrarchaeum limneticum]|uniref:Uncharacterized protein n=1 Tax=Fermentimicrarchaeum limneticum TaxID=2795018 RepID=A0A7D6BT70_FERL1|nr:MAG: hypothetical protein Sv326_0886 [Candidatus Fermentimicrarchaeum limneticum]